MFGFLTPAAKETVDPIASVKGVTTWLRELPATDVVGRQQSVMRAFEAMRQSRRPVDLARAQAIQLLDAALGADRRQLIKQYVENVDSAPKLADRLWLPGVELSPGLIFPYHRGLAGGPRPPATLG